MLVPLYIIKCKSKNIQGVHPGLGRAGLGSTSQWNINFLSAEFHAAVVICTHMNGCMVWRSFTQLLFLIYYAFNLTRNAVIKSNSSQ